MEQRPSSEANSYSASQDVSRLLWNPKVHYCVFLHIPLKCLRKFSEEVGKLGNFLNIVGVQRRRQITLFYYIFKKNSWTGR